jgi:tRNA (guanine37-N1)-methyltransferase
METESATSQAITPRLDIFSLFPAMFAGPLSESIVKRAIDRGLIEIHLHDPRDWTHDRHRTVDDTPYGGGAGMVMKAPPIVEGYEAVVGRHGPARTFVMAAGGRRFNQELASELARTPRTVLICGHYEGIDERVIDLLEAEPLSVGDYVLTGGELPAMIVADAVARLVPGAIDSDSIADESFTSGLLEYPQYTRPVEYRGLRVPDILLSGHHANVRAWRRAQAITRTRCYRPDLLASAPLSPAERAALAERDHD